MALHFIEFATPIIQEILRHVPPFCTVKLLKVLTSERENISNEDEDKKCFKK